MLCDIEWDTPVGEARACGGIALMRVAAFERAQGFRAEPVLGKSALIHTMVKADGIVEIGKDVEGLEEGAMVEVILF
jgi:molybdopterin molybdotransferase